MENFLGAAKKALHSFHNGEYTKAFNSFARLLDFNITPVTKIRIINCRIACQFNVGNLENCAIILNDMLTEFPQEPRAWYYAGKYHTLTHNQEKAIQCYHYAVSASPEFAEAHLALAEALKNSGQAAEAVLAMNRLLARFKSEQPVTKARGIRQQDILAELASLHYTSGKYALCMASLEQSLNLSGEADFLHYELMAKCYLKLEQPVDALEKLEKYFMYNGMLHPDILILIARAQCRLGRLDEAALTFAQALSLAPDLVLEGEETADLLVLKQHADLDVIKSRFGTMELDYR